MKWVCAVVLATAYLLNSVNADCYMHVPRGSNNRLNGNNRNRANANRVFDSQNNNRGGYNKGGDRNSDTPMKYIAGSYMDIEWTNQHECGKNNTYCTIILQYMCEDQVRDGSSTGTIGTNGDNDKSKGQHEKSDWYKACTSRQRNGGLYTGDQKLRGNTARFTRQNPQGTRRGLECPEERDYYPYWVQSPWKDIAILTDQLDRCDWFKAESDNVKAKGYCKGNTRNGTPLTQAQCNGNNLQWVVQQPHNLPPPECIKAPVSRDNQNGNSFVDDNGDEESDRIPQSSKYRWKVPAEIHNRCALRIRYNISTDEYGLFTTSADDNTPKKQSDDCISKIPIAAEYGIGSTKEAKERGYVMESDPELKPLKDEDGFKITMAFNTAQTGRTFQDRSHRFSIVARSANIPAAAVIHNLQVRGKRGNIVQVYPAVEYDFAPNDLNVKKDEYVHAQWMGANTNPRNNDGEGTKGTDRSNIINLAPKRHSGTNPANKFGWPSNSYPQSVDAGTFMNLGKAYAVKAGLPVVGSGNVGDEPISNDLRTFNSAILDEITEIENVLSDVIKKLEKPEEKKDGVVDCDDATTNCGTPDDDDEMLNFDENDVENDPQSRRRRRRRRRRSSTRRAGATAGASNKDVALLNKAPFYVDLGPQKAATCGRWHYMCTRNNNFSNRSQKGRVTVECQ